jgi:hypothetical protein
MVCDRYLSEIGGSVDIRICKRPPHSFFIHSSLRQIGKPGTVDGVGKELLA